MEEKQPLLGGSYGNSFADSYPPPVKKTAEVINIDTAKVYFRSNTKENATQTSLVDSMETVTLTWEHIDVHADPPKRAFCLGPDPNIKRKHILRDVYGNVEPGTLLAIMGASGAGKTTLLNILTSRTQHSGLQVTSGQVLVNGVDLGNGIRNISAYVRQEDMFISTMTVREHLTFRALLRMENTVPKFRRLQRVEDVIAEFGLTGCADTMIGDPGRLKCISGGEMRRLSFASEILTNPPLMFCDEPTSGLDTFMAENVIQTLNNMARKEKTVLCTIHQPSSEVFELFNKILIMAEGRVAFMGSCEDALEFYKSAGYPCPMNYNPADFYIKTMAIQPGKETECRQRVQTIVDAFDKSTYKQSLDSHTAEVLKHPQRQGVIFEEAFSSTSRYESPWYVQFSSLLRRAWNTSVREPAVMRVKLAQTIIVSLSLGLLYLKSENDQIGVMNANGALFLVLANMSYIHVIGVLNILSVVMGLTYLQLGIDQVDVSNRNGLFFLLVLQVTAENLFAVCITFPIEVPVFYKEYGNGLYNVGIYYICKSLAELPSVIIIPCIFSAICYWMIGLYSSFFAFFVFTGVLVLVANVSVSFGYVISVLARDVNMAVATAPPLMVPLIMFGGFLLNTDSIPDYFVWLEYLSWFKYANEVVAVNQWENIDNIGVVNMFSSIIPTNMYCVRRESCITVINMRGNSGCPADGNVSSCDPSCRFPNGESVIQYLNYNKDEVWLDIGLICVLLIAYRLIAFIILLVKAKMSKS